MSQTRSLDGYANMKNSSLIFLKILMWIIAGMHLVVGAGLIVAPGFAQFMAEVYGADVEWTPNCATSSNRWVHSW